MEILNGCTVNSACLVSEYINHRINKAGYNYQTSPTRNFPPDEKVVTALKKVCAEFERRYSDSFFAAIKIEELDNESFFAVLKELVPNGELHWGRVVAAFTFAGWIAVECVKNGRSERVDSIRDWTCVFMNKHVDDWVEDNGGWEGLVEFANANQKQMNGKKDEPNWWKSVVIGGIGAVCLGLVLNKA